MLHITITDDVAQYYSQRRLIFYPRFLKTDNNKRNKYPCICSVSRRGLLQPYLFHLRMILRVDFDVIVGEVAGIDGSRRLSRAEVYMDVEFLRFHGFAEGGGIKAGGLTVQEDDDSGEGSGDVVRVELDTGFTCRHHQSAPVRVVAEQGG